MGAEKEGTWALRRAETVKFQLEHLLGVTLGRFIDLGVSPFPSLKGGSNQREEKSECLVLERRFLWFSLLSLSSQ